jgi:GNAT superfamily N-acetyltransferase
MSSQEVPFTIRPPIDDSEWQALFDLRWRVLRAPWGQPRGSERDELDSTGVHRIAWSQDHRVIGAGRLHLNGPDEGQVRYMAVEEGLRNHGIGRAILDALEEEARRLGVTRIVLNARDQAIPFYLRHGYRVIAPGRMLFGSIAHAVMTKTLGARAG